MKCRNASRVMSEIKKNTYIYIKKKNSGKLQTVNLKLHLINSLDKYALHLVIFN